VSRFIIAGNEGNQEGQADSHRDVSFKRDAMLQEPPHTDARQRETDDEKKE
jgi:hypothetical protein